MPADGATLSVNQAYELIQVKTDCTDEVLKAAYKKQALIYHPDKNIDNPEATAQFQKLQEAKEVIEKHRSTRDGPKFEIDLDDFLLYMFATGQFRPFNFLRPQFKRRSGHAFTDYSDDVYDEDGWEDEFDDGAEENDVSEESTSGRRSSSSTSSGRTPPRPKEHSTSDRYNPRRLDMMKEHLDDERRQKERRQAAQLQREAERKKEQERLEKKAAEKQRKEENKNKAEEAVRRKKEEAEHLAKGKAEEEKARRELQYKRSLVFEMARTRDVQGLRKALDVGVNAEGAEKANSRHPGEPLIHVAARSNMPEILEVVCSHGGRVDEVDSKGRQSLIIAVLSGSFQSAKWLLKNGANSSSLDNQNKSALGYAAERGLINCFDLIIEAGADHQIAHGHKEHLEDFIKERLDLTVPSKGAKLPTEKERSDLLTIYSKLLTLSGKLIPKEYGGKLGEENIKAQSILKLPEVDLNTTKQTILPGEEIPSVESRELEDLDTSPQSNANFSGIFSDPVHMKHTALVGPKARRKPKEGALSNSSTLIPISNKLVQKQENCGDKPHVSNGPWPKHSASSKHHAISTSSIVGPPTKLANSQTVSHNGSGSIGGSRNYKKKKAPSTFESLSPQPDQAESELTDLTARLVDMGFDAEIARILLQKNKFDVSITIDQLTSKSYDKSYVESHLVHSKVYDETNHFEHNSSILSEKSSPSGHHESCMPAEQKISSPTIAETINSTHNDNYGPGLSHSVQSTSAPRVLPCGESNGISYQLPESTIPQNDILSQTATTQYYPEQAHHSNYPTVSNKAGYTYYAQPSYLVDSTPYSSSTTYERQPMFYYPQMVQPFDLSGFMFTGYQFPNGLSQTSPYGGLHPTGSHQYVVSETHAAQGHDGNSHSNNEKIGTETYHHSAVQARASPSPNGNIAVAENNEVYEFEDYDRLQRQICSNPTKGYTNVYKTNTGLNDSLNAHMRGGVSGPSGRPWNYRRSICRHFLRGHCNLMDNCRFLHPDE